MRTEPTSARSRTARSRNPLSPTARSRIKSRPCPSRTEPDPRPSRTEPDPRPSRGGDHPCLSGTGHLRRLAVTTGLFVTAALAVPGGVPSADAEPSRLSGAAGLAAAGDALLAADVPGTAWNADPATGTLIVTADSTVSRADTRRIRKAAGVHAGVIRVERTPGVFTKLLAGGDAVHATGWRCSAGFNVRRGGTYYFLTAGHCAEGAGTWYTNAARTTAIGPTAGSSFPGDDFGLVRYVNGRLPRPGGVGTVDITGTVPARVGMAVTRRGSTTGVRAGTVTGLDATVNYGGGEVVHGMIRTNICAEIGDSGGPLHAGAKAVGLTSGGIGTCAGGGTTFFQPVAEALDAYGVRVY